jgi:hypothetical protein
MACGERFAFLLPPACKGLLSLGVLCSGEDYEVGREYVAEIRRRLIRAWNEIIAVENGLQSWPVSSKHRVNHDAWLARHDALGWQFIASASDVAELDHVARDGVCLLDQLVGDAEATYGGEAVTVPAEPYTPPTQLEQLSDVGRSVVSLAVMGIVALVAYKVWDRYG